MNESNLVQQVARGDELAFRELINEYADFLHTYLARITRSKELSEEIVQDVFVKVWLIRETLHGVKNLRNYLIVLTRNEAYNALKKVSRERLRKARFEYSYEPEMPVQDADDQASLDLIEKAIRQLPVQQRTVWILSRRERKKYHEIAAEMNLSRETVKKYLQYATVSITNYVIRHLGVVLLVNLFGQL